MKDSPLSILLVDDQTMVRAALRSLLDRVPNFKVVGEAGNARAGIEQAAALKPDVAILDITMAGMSGIDAVKPLKAASPRTRVLVASQHEGQSFVLQALQAGADGYLSKDSDPDELAFAITSLWRGESYLSPKIAASVVSRLRTDTSTAASSGALAELTSREREVFQLLAVGKSNKEVGEALHLSLGTVKKHRETLQKKLNCHSAAELARLAIREGLLSL